MQTLEEMNVQLDDIYFEPITEITLIMRGSKTVIVTPLSVEDFTILWNSKKNKINILTGKNSYAYIVKKNVDFYHVSPIKK